MVAVGVILGPRDPLRLQRHLVNILKEVRVSVGSDLPELLLDEATDQKSKDCFGILGPRVVI